MGTINPVAEDILEFFSYDHLPPHLQNTSKLFYELAHELARIKTKSSRYDAQISEGLQKLLEAKDCAVRAAPGRVD